jgi:predicted lipid-binding transport protein (Tim44 family)
MNHSTSSDSHQSGNDRDLSNDSAEMDESLSSTTQAISILENSLESAWATALSLGMATGVFAGGIVGLCVMSFFPGVIQQTIGVGIFMAIGTVIGAVVMSSRQFVNSTRS